MSTYIVSPLALHLEDIPPQSCLWHRIVDENSETATFGNNRIANYIACVQLANGYSNLWGKRDACAVCGFTLGHEATEGEW